MEEESKKRFILVHGSCHGAWCWYKLATLLTSSGHRVTAIDLAGCGANKIPIHDVRSFADHVQPLMEAMAKINPPDKAILVGHSYGGLGLSLAMERFPERISVAVFVTAIMPSLVNAPSSIILEYFGRNSANSMSDSELFFDQGPNSHPTSILFGPKFLASNLYQCCQIEDLTLATMLTQPAPLYLDELSNGSMLSKENYGSVNRVYIVCKEDALFNEDFQRWIIENNPPNDVREIDGSDHMAMLSKPRMLFKCLLEIAGKYS